MCCRVDGGLTSAESAAMPRRDPTHVEPPFTDLGHPVGLRLMAGRRLEIGWGGEGHVVSCDLRDLYDEGAIEAFIGCLGDRDDLPARSAAKLTFLREILLRRIG